MKITRECDMSVPIQEWIKAQGMVAYTEVPVDNTLCDHVGVNWDTNELILIESKLSLTKDVAMQAFRKVPAGDAYVAITTCPRPKSIALATRYGVGILQVTHDGVHVRSRPGTHKVRDTVVNKVLGRLSRLAPGGIGGAASIKGQSQARDVHAAIQRRLDDDLNATWEDLFTSVPNHYASWRSLQSSMKNMEDLGKCEPLCRQGSTARQSA